MAEMHQRTLTLLGATGSVGRNTLDVIADARTRLGPNAYPIAALTAQTRVEDLIALARRFRPEIAVIGDERLYGTLREGLAGTGIAASAGPAAIAEAAGRPSDWVMAAIVGAAGLAPTLAAVARGATIALANKECLVCAGPVFMAAARGSRAMVLPVDSEHSAIFQVLSTPHRAAVERVVLTASGGPFRTWTAAQMAAATPAEAVAHPNWSMGAKISVDSATLMNKGLELIEAAVLFDLPAHQLDAVIHPQSVVHGMVEYADGSVLAQLGAPDMRTPIAVALAWPQRMAAPARRLDLMTCGPLTFEAPDLARFPCFALARKALHAGGPAPTVLNAANEIAVAAFLEGRIGFSAIAAVVEDTLAALADAGTAADLEAVRALDASARRAADDAVAARA